MAESSNPTISVIIPALNEARYLPDCLDSLMRQSVRPLEVIVVDNGSSDGTPEIAKRYPFVRLLHEKVRGTVHARNRGFDAAKGDLLARIDADSILPEDWITTAIKVMEGRGPAAATGRPEFYEIGWPRFFDRAQVWAYQYLQKALTGGYFLWGANMILRRSAWETVRGRCSVRTDIDEDIDLTFCLQEAGLQVRYDKRLVARASLRRGRHDFVSTVRYLSSWPRDYWLHERYFGAAMIVLAVLLTAIVTLPATLAASLQKKNY